MLLAHWLASAPIGSRPTWNVDIDPKGALAQAGCQAELISTV